MDLSRYVELFLTEGRENVAALTAALLELEHAPQSSEAVAAAFRAVHSVKGMAGAMGYAAVGDLAHAMESTLDGARNGTAQVTPSLVAHLLEEADALARAIESAVQRPLAPSSTAAPPARTPRATHVRVRAKRLDALMDLAGEIEIARGRLERTLGATEDATRDAFGHLSRLIAELREQVLTARMVPVGQVFERFPRLVRETARGLGKDVEFTLDGADIELDRSLLDRIGDPLMHLLRNALDHGIETAEERVAAGKQPQGRLTLSAQRETGFVLVRVADDGRGIARGRVLERARAAGLVPTDATALSDAELLRVLAHPGFTTAERVTDVSGRGVGLDVVDATARALGGAIELRSLEGRGTVITLRLPLSVAIVRALLARVGDGVFAIPFTHIRETVELEPPAAVLRGAEWESVEMDDGPAAVLPLRRAFAMPPRIAERMKGVTIDARGRRVALIVDEFVGQQDIVVKRFDPPLGAAPLFAGATVLDDGSPALIVDINRLC